MVKWVKVLEEAKRLARKYYEEHRIALTLRGLFYTLVSANIIPNTRSAYQQLSSIISRARIEGVFPWYLIRDESRAFRWGEVGYSVTDAKRLLNELKNLKPEDKEKLLKQYLKSKYRVRINQWEGQPYSVLMIIEKEAQYETLINMLHELNWDVSVTTARGFESTTAIKRIADWIRSVVVKGRKPVLLFIYDFDPSGEYAGIYDAIYRLLLVEARNSGHDVPKIMKLWSKIKSLDEKKGFISKLVKELGINLIYEKVMLTWEQVRRYNLPPEPEDPNVKKKLERDPRARMFMQKYGFLGQVEIDAMFSLRYDEAKRIIDEAIRKYFDFKIYEQVKKKEEQLKKDIETLLKGE